MNNTVEAKPPNDESDWKAIDIYLFSNGQQNSPPRKYHLRTDELTWWDATLNYLAKSQYGLQHPYIFLYTTDGHKIESPLELKDGVAYVAVEPSDTFVDAGYDKYLVRATRSWEKRQAKKASPVDVTDSPKQGCNHNQPCCLCPEIEEIVNVESERSVLVATEISTLREPDETYKDSVLGRTGQNDPQTGAFDQRTGEYINEPPERGTVNDYGTRMDEKSPRSDEQGRPGQCGRQTADQRYSSRENGRLPGEYGRTLAEQGIMPVEYGRIPVDERLPPDEYTRTSAEHKRTSGERGRSAGDQARAQNEYTPVKQNRNLGESGYPPGEQDRTPGEYKRPADDQISSLGESGYLTGEQGGTQGEYRHPRVDDQVSSLGESVYPPREKGGTQSEYEPVPDEQRRSLGDSKYPPGKQLSTPGEFQHPGGQGRVSGEYERTPFEQGHTPSDNRRTPGEHDRAQGEYDYTSVDHRHAPSEYGRTPSEQVRTSEEFGPLVNQRRTPGESERQPNEQVRTSGEFERTSTIQQRTLGGCGRQHDEQVQSLVEKGNAQDEQGGIPGENRRTSGGQSRTSGEYQRLTGDQIRSLGESGRTPGEQGSTPSAYERPPGGQSRASGEHGRTLVDKGRPPGIQGKQGRTSGEYKRTSSDRGRTPGGQGRISGEYGRTSVDQGARTQSEYGRSQGQQGRERGRTSGEYGRNSGEQQRLTGENERTLVENGQIPRGNRRTTGENGQTPGNYVRKSGERGRLSGEHARTSGDNRRPLDNYRTSNEQKRVSSEHGRIPSERTRTSDARGRTFGAQGHIQGQYERSPGNLETNQPVNLSDYYPTPEESGTKVRDMPDGILADIIEGEGICTGEDLCGSNGPGPKSGKQEDWLKEWGSRNSGIGSRVADVGSRVGEQGRKTVDYQGRLVDPGGKLGDRDDRMGEIIADTGSGYGARLGEQPEKETEYVTIPGGQDTVAELDGEQEDYRDNNGMQGEPEARRGDLVTRLADHGARLSAGGANGATGFSYVSETQQRIRKSSMAPSAPKNAPAADNKRRCSSAAHTSFRRPSQSPVPPASQRRSEDKKTVRNSRDESKKIGLKPPTARSSNEGAATNVVGKQKIVPKYPSKRFTPPAMPLPATSFDQTVIKGKATSLTRIVSNYKSLTTDSATVENINGDKEITVVSTNLFRNQESEITSVRIDLGSKPVLACIRDSEESQPDIHRQQSDTAIAINKEVQTCSEHFTGEMHGDRYGGSSSRHMTRTSSKLKMTRPASSTRLNLVAGDATPDENYIAIINKGDVVNLKLNIEVRSGDTPLNLNHKPVKKSRSLTNITKAEIGSQISIDDDLAAQSKSLQSLINSEFRGTGFEGRPKVVVVQCACCGMRPNNAPRSDTTPSESKKYFVLRPSSQQINAAVEKCDCNPASKQISDQRVHSQVKKQSTSLPIKKTFSSTSIEGVTVREASLPLPRREVGLFMATTNFTYQNDVGRIESPGPRPKVSITEDQMSRCNSVKQIASQTSMTHADYVASRHGNSNSRTHQNCSDSFTQTEWCSVLLEARRREDGRYSFHLPPLQVLRYYSYY